MSDPQRPSRPQTDTLPPGADRFWGQFAETKAGRSRAEEETRAAEPEQPPAEGQHCLEWCPICRSADIVRATTPPDAIGQVQAIQNEAVGVLKSFLAIYAERSGAGARDESGSPDTPSTERPAHDGSGDSSTSGSGGPAVRDISIE
jgi:hypothetical protein